MIQFHLIYFVFSTRFGGMRK